MTNLFDLTGKKAVIAGASSGIGVQFTEMLAGQGADVAILARRYDKLVAVAEEIGAKYPERRIIPIQCDVRQEDEIIEAVRKVMEAFGQIDILLNNAGVVDAVPIEALEEEAWDRVLDTDLKGVFLMSKHVIRHMKERKYGKIINTASMLGLTASASVPTHSYNAAKGGVIHLTRGVAATYAKHGITVNAIGPSLFRSEMTENTLFTEQALKMYNAVCPMGRPGNPGELNGAVLYFASDASSYTTGQTLFVDGGWTII
ncbi:SDR family NAD(P)-dependent oxidoreductase [Paenibacillus graminis]|uniref:Short-chain dehydrogenase n=1 Tax=Paenibacillus graminis TaxID=189425 RepID=A0A089NDJ3_9BACL|nr:SDR family oxidoreductase [Paenibacillus graminis]AIQ67059.1 short-chain dehydrogenase [Paenibacillus graminis]